MKLNVQTNQIITSKITITGDDILNLLKSKYPEHFRTSPKSRITFQVPGGEELDIDPVNPISIHLLTERTER